MILEVRPIQEQVVQLHIVEAARAPGVELSLDLLTHPRHRRARHPGLLAQGFDQSGLDIAGGQPAHEPSDHQRFQRVGLSHPSTEQLRGEPLGRAAQLRPLHGHRPGGGLDRGRAVPIAHSRSGVLAGSAAFVAFAAQKRRHLALDRGLQQQLGSQLGDPLQGYGQIGAASEHLVDLCVQPLARRYPLRHGRGLLPLVA